VVALPAVTFTAIARVQVAVTIGNRSIGGASDTVFGTITQTELPPTVLVLDQDGVPVRGVVVSWSAGGGGTVAPVSPVTDAGGEAMAEYTFGGVAGTGYTAAASVPGLVGSPVEFQLRALPGNPVVLARSGGDGLAVPAGGKVIHRVVVTDAYGNPTRGVRVEWAVGAGGGSVAPALTVTDPDGRAETVRTLGLAAGLQTATATTPELPGAPVVTFTTTAQPAPQPADLARR
jgi:hypothetical protein